MKDPTGNITGYLGKPIEQSDGPIIYCPYIPLSKEPTLLNRIGFKLKLYCWTVPRRKLGLEKGTDKQFYNSESK
jgi:hypothetical protein